MPTLKIFSGTFTKKLAKAIANNYGKTLGNIEREDFSDGEISVRYEESVRGCNVYLIQSTFSPAENIWELFMMIDAAKRASAREVSVVIPYFGYARQDRKDKSRVSITAKLMANMIQSAGADRIMTCDLHAGQIQGFFDIPVDHLDASAIFIPYLKSLNLKNLIFATPDVGGTARARQYAKIMAVDMVVCDKHRKRANEIASMQLIGDVEGKDVVLVDDMIDTAGTISRAASIIKEKGASSIRAIAAHGLLSGNAIENIMKSSLEELFITDTIPQKNVSKKIKILSVANLFAKAIRKIHDHESISSLFINNN